MATTTNITSTYAGEFAGKYVSAMLLSGNTIANGLIEVKPNIKFKEVLKRLEIDGIVANASCDFADTSTVALTERIIEPKELQVNLELCKTPFISDWQALEMGFSAFDNLLAADAAHTGGKKITGEAVNAANVVTELGLVIDAIPEQLLQNEGLYVYVANNVYRAYKRALGGFQANGLGAKISTFKCLMELKLFL